MLIKMVLLIPILPWIHRRTRQGGNCPPCRYFSHFAGRIGLNLKVGIYKQGYLKERSSGVLFKSRLWYKCAFNYLWTNKNRMSKQSWWFSLQVQRLRVQSPKLIIHGDEKNKGTTRTNTRKVVYTECGTNINSENKTIRSKRVILVK